MRYVHRGTGLPSVQPLCGGLAHCSLVLFDALAVKGGQHQPALLLVLRVVYEKHAPAYYPSSMHTLDQRLYQEIIDPINQDIAVRGGTVQGRAFYPKQVDAHNFTVSAVVIQHEIYRVMNVGKYGPDKRKPRWPRRQLSFWHQFTFLFKQQHAPLYAEDTPRYCSTPQSAGTLPQQMRMCITAAMPH